MKAKSTSLLMIMLIIGIMVYQKDEIEDIDNADIEEITNPDGYVDWTETTHGNGSYPDYSIVFSQNNVLRFDIEISSTNWLASPKSEFYILRCF